MSEFVVHTIPGSPFARAVLIALEEKSAKYRVVPVAPGALRTDEHLALHPFGRVPVLEHGEFRLFETSAILRYLERVLPTPALIPAESRAAARMDQVMNINDWYLFQGVGNVIVFQRVIRPRILGQPADEEAIAVAMPKAHRVFDELDRQLRDRPFFAGSSISLADVIVAPGVDFFRATPEWAPLTAKTPNLCGWLDRMNTRPSMAATTWERVAEMAKAA
jgi:glutathione S-transferase